MKVELRRIGLFSAIKTLFILGGVTGFMIGILEWALLAMLTFTQAPLPTELYGLEGTGMQGLLDAGVGALAILLPFLGGFSGAIAGVLLGGILTGFYNLAARLWGGLEFEWKELSSSTASQTVPPRPSQPGQATPLPGAGMIDHRPARDPGPNPDTPRRPPSMYE